MSGVSCGNDSNPHELYMISCALKLFGNDPHIMGSPCALAISSHGAPERASETRSKPELRPIAGATTGQVVDGMGQPIEIDVVSPAKGLWGEKAMIGRIPEA